MRNEFYNPVQVEFGRHSIEFLPRFVKGRNALLLTSKGFVKRGLVEKLKLNNPNIVSVISTVQPNPTIEQVEEIRNTVDYETFEVIIALGGGSVIDVAKAIAPIAKNERLIDLLNNGIPSQVEVKPIIAIPTTAGTGSEVTMWGTIWDEKNKRKYSIMDERLYCEAAILDPMLHLTIPYDITIQTGLDALSHSLESIWNKNNNPISTLYAKRAISEILEVLPQLANDLQNIEYRERMLLASYHAGIAFSNTQTSIAHAISYYLTLEKGIPHGIAASITLPYILEVFKETNPHDLLDLHIDSLINIFNHLGVLLDLTSYKINPHDLDEIEKSLTLTPRASNSLVKNDQLFNKLKSVLK